jgi:hypothetical protein
MFNLNETNVARHYDRGGFEYDSVRLEQYSPVEFAMTSRYLDRWIRDRATVRTYKSALFSQSITDGC